MVFSLFQIIGITLDDEYVTNQAKEAAIEAELIEARKDGKMFLAFPAIITLEDLDINLRSVMMLELSQLE